MVLPLPSRVASGDSAELAATEAAVVYCVVSPCVLLVEARCGKLCIGVFE